MRVIFRTDASSKIGTGHVIRCLTLADALRLQSAECKFVCRAHQGHLIDYIKSRGYEVLALNKPKADEQCDSDLAHAQWLGVNWETDADQTINTIADERADWFIVDHYALDYRWEFALRAYCQHIMVIDDLADRNHDCELLLDQNYGSSIQRYHDLVPAHCKQLHGPSFALLRPLYSERRAQMPARDGQIQRVLIYFGGGANAVDMTCLVLEAFQHSELLNIKLDIVIGAAYSQQKTLKESVAFRGNASINSQLPDLAYLMAIADLAIGAGGATTWERCCLGLPTIVVSIAENQRPACRALSEHKLIDYLGHDGGVTAEIIYNRVIYLINNPKIICQMSMENMALVDGQGLNRLVPLLK